MNVAIINGSPKLEKGNTALILNSFANGLKDSGCNINHINVVKHDINPCSGEFICCTKTPGKCFKQDDMETILPILADTDLWVISSPVYSDGVSAQTKVVLDRIVPLLSPLFRLVDGHCRHPWREPEKQEGKVVLVSSCGHWEMDNFDSMICHMKAFCRNAGKTYSGSLLRPHASVLKQNKNNRDYQDIFNIAYHSGHTFKENGSILQAHSNIVSRELITREEYMRTCNAYFE